MGRNRKIFIIGIALFIIFNVSHLPASRAASIFDAFEGGIEKEIGYYNYSSLIRQKKPVQLSVDESRRLDVIFSNLVAHSSRNRQVNFKLTVVKDPTINAFALPGGYVFINTGLLDFARSDAEIAGVLGHEIGHIDCKHGMKTLYRTVGMAAMWSLVMHKNDSRYKDTLNRIAGVSMALVQLGYSREAEFEADQYGVKLMTSSGYSKADLLNFWKRVAAEEGSGEMSGFFKFLSTHPPLSERIQRIENINL